MTTNDNSNERDRAFEQLGPLAESLPADAVRAPDMPMEVFLAECADYVIAAREHQDALVEVGMPAELIDSFEQRFWAASVAQTRWSVFYKKGRSQPTEEIIDSSEATRREALAMSDLALRKSADGQRRLGNIREGEGLADLVADLFDLAQLFKDAPDQFRAVKMDPVAWADKCYKAATSLQDALGKEHAEKSLSFDKERRDRYYTLCLEPLRELRAFAAFAFRNDKNNQRRFAFTSRYIRRRVRKYRQAARSVASAIVDGVVDGE